MISLCGKNLLMKKLFYGFIVLIFLQENALAQDSAFVINGKLEKIQTGLIYLNIYQNSQTFMDSAFIKDGLFILLVLSISRILPPLPCREGRRIFYPFMLNQVYLPSPGGQTS